MWLVLYVCDICYCGKESSLAGKTSRNGRPTGRSNSCCKMHEMLRENIELFKHVPTSVERTATVKDHRRRRLDDEDEAENSRSRDLSREARSQQMPGTSLRDRMKFRGWLCISFSTWINKKGKLPALTLGHVLHAAFSHLMPFTHAFLVIIVLRSYRVRVKLIMPTCLYLCAIKHVRWLYVVS